MSKLYTEKQVKQMIEKSRETGLNAEYLILTTPAIELPTNEDIYDIALDTFLNDSKRFGFIEGAKWMRYRIKKIKS